MTLGIVLTVALSHPVVVAWARELVGAEESSGSRASPSRAAAGAVAPAELPLRRPDEDEVAENVADETQVWENSGDDADAAQASEEEGAPSNQTTLVWGALALGLIEEAVR